MKLRTMILLAAALPLSALAASRQVTLAVPGMNCPVCPITVKQALQKVPGVSAAAVDYDKREARVTFDDARTTLNALTDATRDAGYPSSVKAAPK